FGVGASIPAFGYLVVFANDPDGTPGTHLGFKLPQEGGALYLYDAAANGGALIDSVAWGPQLTDYSIGRLNVPASAAASGAASGAWALTVPTFGAVNRPASVGDPAKLRINEWLALGTTPFDNDFIELYNADSLPVAMGGLFLSDETVGVPNKHQIDALSFI